MRKPSRTLVALSAVTAGLMAAASITSVLLPIIYRDSTFVTNPVRGNGLFTLAESALASAVMLLFSLRQRRSRYGRTSRQRTP